MCPGKSIGKGLKAYSTKKGLSWRHLGLDLEQEGGLALR